MKPVQIPRFKSIGTTVIELCVFNKKKKYMYIEHGQNSKKIHFSLDISGIFMKYLVYIHLYFNMLCHVKMLKVKFT